MVQGKNRGELKSGESRSHCRVEQSNDSKRWGCRKICNRVLKEREQITFNLTANSAGDWLEVEPTDCFCHWNSLFS